MTQPITAALPRLDDALVAAVLHARAAANWYVKYGWDKARAQALHRELLAYCSHRLRHSRVGLDAAELSFVAVQVDRLDPREERVTSSTWRALYDAYMATVEVAEDGQD